MQIKRLLMRNFLSVGDNPVEILFPEKNGLTLIKGLNQDISDKSSNGAGKSTIIEGILFALYGKTLRKLKKEEYYINDKATGDCVVEIEFDNVKILRRFTLTKKGKKKEGEVEFYVDGLSKSTDASLAKVKEDIADHIAVGFETMCNILIFGQHNMVSFLEAGEPEKREIVESLMNLREYNAYEERAKKELRETETKLKVLAGTHSEQMRHLGEQIALRHEQEKKHDAYIVQLDNDIKVLQLRLESIPNMNALKTEWANYTASEANKLSLKERITELTTKKNTLVGEMQKEMEKKQPLLDNYNALSAKQRIIDARKKERLDAETSPLAKETEELRNTLVKINREYSDKFNLIVAKENWDALISSAKKLLNDAKASLSALQSKNLVHDETCPECFGKIDISNCANIIEHRKEEVKKNEANCAFLVGSKITDQARVTEERAICKQEEVKATKDIVAKIETINAEIALKENAILDDYTAACSKLSSLMESAKTKIDKFDTDINTAYAEDINKYTEELGVLNRELFLIKNAKKPDITLEELATMQANAENDRKTLAEKKAARKINPFSDIIDSLTENITKIDKSVKKAEEAVKTSESLIPYLKFWVAGFGKEGIKSFIINQIVPTLNEQIDYWMQIIYQGAISVSFDKLLNVTMVNNASKNEMIFGQGSGGERRRIDIAIMLAFRQIMKLSTGRDPSVVFFDEVAESLDEEGVMRLYEALEDICKNSRVYVITHNPALLTLLNNADKLIVKKKGGVMTLVN
jgi:DNA repair exonuclease SbcCD ATPase subunit